MQQIIKDLDAVIEKANALIKATEQKAHTLALLDSHLAAREDAIKERETKIIERECEVQKVESVVKLHEEATALAHKTEKAVSEFNHQRSAWHSEYHVQIQELKDKRAAVLEEAKNVEAAKKHLQDASNQIDTKVKDRVEEVLKQLGVKK